MLLNKNKRVSKNSLKILHNGELKGYTSNENMKVLNVKQIWVKKMSLNVLLSIPHLGLVSHIHCTLIVVVYVI